MINKDTKIFGSFSDRPGNNGCKFFNEKFAKNNINAIYKSFYCNDILLCLIAAVQLKFSGFAVSMPFKEQVVTFLDEVDDCVNQIGACNTVTIKNGKTKGYNTDWKGVYKYLKNNNIESLSIYGNGGFSKAVQYACKKLDIEFEIITRENWEQSPKYEYVFNATPVEVKHKNLIDGRPDTKTGKELSKLQAQEQYEIYELS
jgi:shikimate dehydrogenase